MRAGFSPIKPPDGGDIKPGAGPRFEAGRGNRWGDEPGRTGGQGERSGHAHPACRERIGKGDRDFAVFLQLQICQFWHTLQP